jgi:hypothetical protein
MLSRACQGPAGWCSALSLRLRTLILLACVGLLVPAGNALADGGPIMPLSAVQPGMNCTGETVVQGTTISSFAVHVIDVVESPGEGPRILVQASGPAVDATGIAEGFSGSPVYCPDAFGTMENAGAISEGIGQYGNNVALVTPIEQMLGEPVDPPSSAPRLGVRATPLLGPLTVGGLAPSVFGLLQRAAVRAGRVVLAAPTPTGTAVGFPVQTLVPGASVGASYSSGAITLGAVGVVTYVDGQTVYAFGHELDGAGRRALLLQDAYVYYVVNNPDPTVAPSYKLALPGHTVGIVSSDTPNAVIGQVRSPPPSIPVGVTVHDLDAGTSLALNTLVADETDVGLPLGTSLLDTIAPLDVAQAATQIYNGAPAGESGRMCLRIYLRESRAPLGFCNRYVGTGAAGDSAAMPPELASAAAADVATAFSQLEQVDFAALHVKRVTANLDAQRGLAEGSIVSAHGPGRVHPGQLVRVRLRVRIFRGPLRAFTFRLRIPAHASGRLLVTIRGPAAPAGPSPGSQSLAGALASALSSSSSESAQGPAISSLAELRAAIAGIGSYDGLYANVPGSGKRPVYRNPALLITGRTLLPFVVGG